MTEYAMMFRIDYGATKYGGRLVFQSRSLSLVHIETFQGIFVKGGLYLQMITISLESIYYIVVIISVLAGAAYKLGYENGKNAKK